MLWGAVPVSSSSNSTSHSYSNSTSHSHSNSTHSHSNTTSHSHSNSHSNSSIIDGGPIAPYITYSNSIAPGTAYSVNINVQDTGNDLFVKITANNGSALQIFINNGSIATVNNYVETRKIASPYPEYAISIGPCQLTTGIWYISVFGLQSGNLTDPNATVDFDIFATLESTDIISANQNTNYSVCCDEWVYFYMTIDGSQPSDMTIVLTPVQGPIFGIYSLTGDCPSTNVYDQKDLLDFSLSFYNLPQNTILYIGVHGDYDPAIFTLSIIQAQQPLTPYVFIVIGGVLVFLIIVCFLITRSKKGREILNSIRSVRRTAPPPVAPPSYEEQPPSDYPDSYVEDRRRSSARKSNRKTQFRDDDYY